MWPSSSQTLPYTQVLLKCSCPIQKNDHIRSRYLMWSLSLLLRHVLLSGQERTLESFMMNLHYYKGLSISTKNEFFFVCYGHAHIGQDPCIPTWKPQFGTTKNEIEHPLWYLKITIGNPKITTRKWLDLDTLGSRSIMPKNLPWYWWWCK